ncbi:hypothetical protein FJZ40_00695 [Candidatus Shapirobacteria bacterium]|nr:hypothetical protein [Candidatus Shapirobacteria bacterium]
MAKGKPIRIGLDLDGVVARHALGGFWVVLRKAKEKVLKQMHTPSYYYPNTPLERFVWRMINHLRIPFKDKEGLFPSLIKEKRGEFFLITGRFKFLEEQTLAWLKKYGLDGYFARVLVNTENEDPIFFKAKAINQLNLDFFVDDDLEVVNELRRLTKTKLCWIVPGHRNKGENHHQEIVGHTDLVDALEKIFKSKKDTS